jgi:hypothetical protein
MQKMPRKTILLTTPEVQAVMAGKKTQKRVPVQKDISNRFDIDVDGTAISFIDQATGDCHEPKSIARYQPGDMLWVQETWMPYGNMDHWATGIQRYAYKADMTVEHLKELKKLKAKWRPSIHMPRAAARLLLQVIDVRVERLQDISQADVVAEGIRSVYNQETDVFCSDGFIFKELWNGVNAKRGYSWDTNPWVWVYVFRKIMQADPGALPTALREHLQKLFEG